MQQQRTVECGGNTIPYMLRKRRGQKRLVLSVRADGAVVLSVPWWVSVRAALGYMEQKRDWLARALASVTARTSDDGREHYHTHKEAARTFIHTRLQELNTHYGFSWGRVAVRKNASCWGSCSNKKNLNFDYRILFLPVHLQDYVLVHELCHLAELNHSPRFWALVARAVPDHVRRRKALRSVQRHHLAE